MLDVFIAKQIKNKHSKFKPKLECMGDIKYLILTGINCIRDCRSITNSGTQGYEIPEVLNTNKKKQKQLKLSISSRIQISHLLVR